MLDIPARASGIALLGEPVKLSGATRLPREKARIIADAKPAGITCKFAHPIATLKSRSPSSISVKVGIKFGDYVLYKHSEARFHLARC